MAFTRLSTAAQVKAHIENIETSELTDSEIEGYIDAEDKRIRNGYGYPYLQVVTETSPNEFNYFLGQNDLYAVERVFYDRSEISTPTDYTVDLEKGLLTLDAGFSVESKELRVYLMPSAFNELSAVRAALFIMRLSESFTRGEPSQNLQVLEMKHREIKRRIDTFYAVKTDGMGLTWQDSEFGYIGRNPGGFKGEVYHPVYYPYGKNEVRIVQDHDVNAYL